MISVKINGYSNSWGQRSVTWAICSVNITPKDGCHQGQEMLVCRASTSGNDTLRWAGQANALGMCSHGEKLTFYNCPNLQTREQSSLCSENKTSSSTACQIKTCLQRGKEYQFLLADLCSGIKIWNLLSTVNSIRIRGALFKNIPMITNCHRSTRMSGPCSLHLKQLHPFVSKAKYGAGAKSYMVQIELFPSDNTRIVR